MLGKLVAVLAVAINVAAIAVLFMKPRPEGPHAFGTGYGVGRARAALMIGGPDRPGATHAAETGLGPDPPAEWLAE